MKTALAQRATPRAAVLLAGLICACAVSACGADTTSSGTARAADPAARPGTRQPPIDLSDAARIDADPVGAAAQLATYWAGYQLPSGDVWDPVYQRGGIRYSEAEWAYAAIHLAAKSGDPKLAEFGLRAAEWVADRPGVQKTAPSGFEDAAMAGLAVDLPSLPPSALRDRVTPKVRAWLAHYRHTAFLPDRVYHTNKSLVEAVGILDMLKAKVPLPRAAFWRERALGVIGTSMPERARAYTTTTSLGPTTVFSDPPKNPISYHALTLGYLARAVAILGPRAPAATRQLLVQMARGLVFLTPPDGDFAAWGRSQGQAWSLAFGAYGLRAAERYAPAAQRPRLAATAEALLGELQRRYHQGPYGLFYVPAFADLGRPYVEPRGVDPYANAVTYVGLAVKALTWLQDVPAAPPVGAAAAAALTGTPVGAVKLNAGSNGETVVVRRPKLWFGVRPFGMLDGNHGYDLRYDFGLYAAQAQNAQGAWVDLIRPRPETDGTGVDSAGPVLVTSAGRRGYPTAESVQTDPQTGQVTVATAWMHGTSVLGRGNVVFVPAGAGVRVAALAPPGTRLELSVFARAPVVTKGAIADGPVVAQLGPGARVKTDRARYGSAYDRVQRRVRVTFPPASPAWITYRLGA